MIRKIITRFNQLPRERQILIGAGLGVVLCIFGLLRLYDPLLSEIKQKAKICTDLEVQAFAARQMALSSWGGIKKFMLIQENEISTVLDEMTRKGKIRGINFVSIVPQAAVKKEGVPLRTLPLELDVKSSYKSLGVFLGQLQEIENSFLSLRSLKITPDSSYRRHVSAHISLDVYLSN